jgi:hypothetical protein
MEEKGRFRSSFFIYTDDVICYNLTSFLTYIKKGKKIIFDSFETVSNFPLFFIKKIIPRLTVIAK